MSPLCILECLYVYQPFPFVAQARQFLYLLREYYQKENPHHLVTQGDHVKANKCNHMIRVSRCVTSLYPGVFVCLPAFPLGGTSEIVKFFWGRGGGHDL